MPTLLTLALLSLVACALGTDTETPPSIIPATPAAVFRDDSHSFDGRFVFALSVYQDTNATSNPTDIYIHMSAPSSYQWMAVGVRSSMRYALMWIAYPSQDGTTTTLSTRIAGGHHEPDHLDDDWGCEQILDGTSA